MKKVLVTDDNPGLQDIYRIILERAGYEVAVLSNGTGILNNHYEAPDLFLLDKQLSGTDGIELCRFLKSKKDTQSIPIIIISASVGIDKLAREAGADGFIEKPFEKKYLLDMIADKIK